MSRWWTEQRGSHRARTRRGARSGRALAQDSGARSGFIGFAVGRTSFWQPLVDYKAKRISKEEAVTYIAHNFEAWIRIFEEARGA